MQSDMFEKNLAALRTGNPGVADAVASVADEQNAEWRPAPGFDGAGLVRELQPAALDILLTLGFGDGIWLQEFSDAAPGCELHVFEMIPQRLARALRGADLSRLFTSGRLHLFTGSQAINAFASFFYSSFANRAMKRIFHETEKSGIISFQQHIMSTDSQQELTWYQGLMQQLAPHFQNLKRINAAYANIKTHAADLAEFLGEDPEKLAPSILHRIGGRILDFGGGDGDMTLRLARRGLNIEYCDVPGRTMEFAQWRFKKHGFDIPCIVSDDPDTVKLNGLYDIIICMDVLEHLVGPMRYCEILYKHLRPSGVLFTRPSFTHDELHPMHLAENVKYHETFDATMERIGFQQRQITHSEIFMLAAWIKTGGG